jgi:hypothetical protein
LRLRALTQVLDHRADAQLLTRIGRDFGHEVVWRLALKGQRPGVLSLRIQQGGLQPEQTLRVGEVELSLDTPKAAISVPKLTDDAPASTLTPPPGTVSCVNHQDIAAGYHCPHCDKNFCESCVRTLKLLKGHIHKLCPLCSAHCQPIVYEKKRKRRSLLEVVQSTFGFSEKGTTQKM